MSAPTPAVDTARTRPDAQPAVPALPTSRWTLRAAPALLALLAVLALAAALRWTWPAEVEDLRPRPDALEYEEAARNLAAGRGYLLWIGNRAYPPRYPPGMSALIAASIPIFGAGRGVGIWVVLASALASIAATYALARRAGGASAGLFAALLLAISPLHVLASEYVMSDVPATAVVALIGYGVLVVLDGRAPALGCVALGILCGLAVVLRQPLVLVAFAAWLAVGLLGEGTVRERMRRLALVGAGGVVGVAPLLWINWQLFGSPLRSGYGYWAPHAGFGLDRATAPPEPGRPSNLAVYLMALAGNGWFYPATASPLLALGSLAALRRGGTARRLCAFTWLATLFLTAFLLLYALRSNRLLLPVLPLIVASMSLCCASAAPRWMRASGLVLVALTLVAVLGPQRHLLDLPFARNVGDVAALRRLAQLTERDAVILAQSEPFGFAQLLRAGADRRWVPLRPDAHQLAIGLNRLPPVATDAAEPAWLEPPIGAAVGREQLLARTSALCATGRPVYLSAQLADAVPFFAKIERWLRERWTLTEVAGGEPWLYRVECAVPRDRQPS